MIHGAPRGETAAATAARSLPEGPSDTLPPMRAATRFLRRPRTIVGEVAALTVVFALSTVGWLTPFTSPWFLALVGTTLASLALVVKDQSLRSWRLWRRPVTLNSFRGAPYRREKAFCGATAFGAPVCEIRIRGTLGTFGSPLFHAGLLVVVFASLLRAAFGAEAVAELMAGETLDPVSGPYAFRRQGLLAHPFSFPQPVTLEEIRVSHYASGATKRAEGAMRLGRGPASEVRPIGINCPIRIGVHSFHVSAEGGIAALVEARNGEVVDRRAILLREGPSGSAAQAALSDGTLLRVSSNAGGLGRVPSKVELRAVRDGALLGAAVVGPRDEMAMPGAGRVRLAALVPWVKVTGQRDVSTPVVYLGFALAFAGAVLMLAVVRVESAVVREPDANGTKLTVVMRPYRFAPLFAPAFEDLWERSAASLRDPSRDERREGA